MASELAPQLWRGAVSPISFHADTESAEAAGRRLFSGGPGGRPKDIYDDHRRQCHVWCSPSCPFEVNTGR
eukprot:15475774-Alexandrium_andersonii.AAC.1